MRVTRIFEACLCAGDLAVAHDFYTRVLGLTVASDFSERGIAFRCGDGVVIVFDPAHSQYRERGIPGHATSGAGHLAFAVDGNDLPAWRAHLEACGVPIESEVDWPSGGRSIYFRDPAGNSLELAPPTLWGIDRV
jgi:catechol 2,3-dioxygenase-like lactoylglutathione lyase family enzyme